MGVKGLIFHAWANTIGIESKVTKTGADALSHGMIRKGIIKAIPITEANNAILER